MIRTFLFGSFLSLFSLVYGQSTQPTTTFNMLGEKESLRVFEELEDGFLLITNRDESVYAYKLNTSFEKVWAKELVTSYYPGWSIDQKIMDDQHLFVMKQDDNLGVVSLQILSLEDGTDKMESVRLPFSAKINAATDGGDMISLIAGDNETAHYVELSKADYSWNNHKEVDLPRIGRNQGKWVYAATVDGWYYWNNPGWVFESEDDAEQIVMEYYAWNPLTDGAEESEIVLETKELGIDGYFVHGYRKETPSIGASSFVNGQNAIPTYNPKGKRVYLAGYWCEQSWPKAAGFWVVKAKLDQGKVLDDKKVLVEEFWGSKAPFRMSTYYAPSVDYHPDFDLMMIHHAEYMDRAYLKQHLGHSDQSSYFTSILVGGKEVVRAAVDISTFSGKPVLYSFDRMITNGADWTVTNYLKELQYKPEMPAFFQFFIEVARSLDKKTEYACYYDNDVQVIVVADQKEDKLLFYRYTN